MEYYYTDSNNQVKGPVSLDQLQELARAQILNASSMICPLGGQRWTPLETLIPALAPAPLRPTEPLAVWSFILGLLAFGCCGFLTGIPGIICGHKAMTRFHLNPQADGRGLAIAGLILNYVGSILWVFYVIFYGGLFLIQSLSHHTP